VSALSQLDILELVKASNSNVDNISEDAKRKLFDTMRALVQARALGVDAAEQNTNAIDDAVNAWLGGHYGEVQSTLADVATRLSQTTDGAVVGANNSIQEALESTKNYIVDRIRETGAYADSALQEMYPAVSADTSEANSALDDFLAWLQGGASGFLTGGADILSGLADSLKTFITNPLGAVTDLLNTLKEKLIGAATTTLEGVLELVSPLATTMMGGFVFLASSLQKMMTISSEDYVNFQFEVQKLMANKALANVKALGGGT